MNMVWLVQNENQYSFVEVTMKQFDGWKFCHLWIILLWCPILITPEHPGKHTVQCKNTVTGVSYSQMTDIFPVDMMRTSLVVR